LLFLHIDPWNIKVFQDLQVVGDVPCLENIFSRLALIKTLDQLDTHEYFLEGATKLSSLNLNSTIRLHR